MTRRTSFWAIRPLPIPRSPHSHIEGLDCFQTWTGEHADDLHHLSDGADRAAVSRGETDEASHSIAALLAIAPLLANTPAPPATFFTTQ
jgi:hypothetical protein